MKKGLFILALSLLAGVAAFFFMRSHMMESEGSLADSMSELGWFRQDLKLTGKQLTEVSNLHAAYRPKCEEMCECISESQEKIEALASKNRKMTPELVDAIREHDEILAECQQTMLKHIYETAEAMDENQAARYLKTMIPYALNLAHNDSGTSSPR